MTFDRRAFLKTFLVAACAPIITTLRAEDLWAREFRTLADLYFGSGSSATPVRADLPDSLEDILGFTLEMAGKHPFLEENWKRIMGVEWPLQPDEEGRVVFLGPSHVRQVAFQLEDNRPVVWFKRNYKSAWLAKDIDPISVIARVCIGPLPHVGETMPIHPYDEELWAEFEAATEIWNDEQQSSLISIFGRTAAYRVSKDGALFKAARNFGGSQRQDVFLTRPS